MEQGREAVEWPHSEQAFQLAAAGGAAYAMWQLWTLGARWASVLGLLYGFLAGMIVWMVVGLAVIAIGRALDRHIPTWAAVAAQVAATPPLLLLFAYLLGGVWVL